MASISNLTSPDGALYNSPTNHGPVVSVLTWLLIVATFLAVVARLATRLVAIHTVRMDDIVISLALLFAIGQSVAVSLEAAAGLGQPMVSLSSSAVMRFQKSAYAADIMYVLALAFTKCSIVIYINSLTPVRMQKLAGLAVSGFTGLWAFSSVFVLAFKCHTPQVWDEIHGKCIDVVSFWTYFDVINILTDLALIVIPCVMLASLQMKLRRKIVIILCFSTRIATVAATAVQIYFLHRDSTNINNLTFDLWTLVLITQVVQSSSIVTACVPYLKPFLEALETGMIRADGGATTRKGLDSNYVYGGSNGGNSWNRYRQSNEKNSQNRSQQDSISKRQEGIALANLHPGHTKAQTAIVSAQGRKDDSDGDSQSSQSKIIKKQVDWTLTDEHILPNAI